MSKNSEMETGLLCNMYILQLVSYVSAQGVVLLLVTCHVHELNGTRTHQVWNHGDLKLDAVVLGYEDPVLMQLVRNAALTEDDRNVIEDIDLLRLSRGNGCLDDGEHLVGGGATVIEGGGVDLSVGCGGGGRDLHDVDPVI